MHLSDHEAFDADCLMSMMEKISSRIAAEGNAVVVGRGAPFFLREREDTFSVFLYAPREDKIRRLLESGKRSAEAQELVDTVDRERMTFIKHYFNADWPTRSLYRMMINTAPGDEFVLTTILESMHRLEKVPAMVGSSKRS
jgi:cytidylate kinase